MLVNLSLLQLMSLKFVSALLLKIVPSLVPGLKQSCFVSCNPTLTSFHFKKSLPKVFSPLPTPNQHKTCIKHTFLTNFLFPTYLPYFFLPVTRKKQFFFYAPSWMAIPGYATSRSRSTASARLLAQALTRTMQEVLRMCMGNFLSNVNKYESPHSSVS